jgi:hypothetical protein
MTMMTASMKTAVYFKEDDWSLDEDDIFVSVNGEADGAPEDHLGEYSGEWMPGNNGLLVGTIDDDVQQHDGYNIPELESSGTPTPWSLLPEAIDSPIGGDENPESDVWELPENWMWPKDWETTEGCEFQQIDV